MAGGNYMPDPRSAYTPPEVFYGDQNISGTGSPEGVIVAWPGAVYVNRSNGALYKKVSGDGTAVGWSLVNAGGSGAEQVFRDTGDPSGDPGVDVALHLNTSNDELWFWNGTTWKKLISAGA
jgi:hypothetical protein